ncbi:MAG TPA: flagellar filament capping protein FliD [Clostridiales bacterium]|nr:flagellar filament capping protein FliD [Clostridiales bacterium]
MSISSAYRITGLASGLDTEQLVSEMLSASKAKVNQAKQQKVILEWKQETYKSVISKLSDFQKKYTNASSGLASSLKTPSAGYSSPYISVTPSERSSGGSFVIRDIVSLAEAATLSGNRASADPSLTVQEEALADLAGKSLTITLDGVSKTIQFSEAPQTVQETKDTLSSLLANAFGEGKITVSAEDNILTLRAENNSVLGLRLPDNAEQSPAGILDFSGYTSNRTDLSLPVSLSGLISDPEAEGEPAISFLINGITFFFEKGATLSRIMNEINKSNAGVTITYSSLTDKFTLTSKETGAGASISVEDVSGSLMSTLFGEGTYRAGTDAEMHIRTQDGEELTLKRSTNSFDIDGTVVRLLGKAEGPTQENIQVSLEHDLNGIADKVANFINDYNELLGMITKLTSEKVYKDYKPLTEDERKHLSDEEAKLWTEKARSGILRSDPYLTAIENELRSVFYTAIDELGGLDQIGISTGSYKDKGRLQLDRTKLMEALNRDADKVIHLLTKESASSFSLYAPTEQQQKRFSENGVLNRLSDLLNKNLSNIGKKGSLILLVGGADSTYDSNSDYALRIKAMDEKIARLEAKMEAEEDRYWKQFTAMESALARLNSQSAYIANLFGNNGNTY